MTTALLSAVDDEELETTYEDQDALAAAQEAEAEASSATANRTLQQSRGCYSQQQGFCDQPPNTKSGEARETRRKESGDALRDEPLRGRGIGDKEGPHRLRYYQVDGVIEGGGWSATHECTTARFRSFFCGG